MGNDRQAQTRDLFRDLSALIRRWAKWFSPTIKESISSIIASVSSVFLLIQLGLKRDPSGTTDNSNGRTPESEGAAPAPETPTDTATPDTPVDTATPSPEEPTSRFEQPVEDVTPEPAVEATRSGDIVQTPSVTETYIATETPTITERPIATGTPTITEVPVENSSTIATQYLVADPVVLTIILTGVFLVLIVSTNRIRHSIQ